MNDITQLEHAITERLIADIDKALKLPTQEELYRAIMRFQLWTSALESKANALK